MRQPRMRKTTSGKRWSGSVSPNVVFLKQRRIEDVKLFAIRTKIIHLHNTSNIIIDINQKFPTTVPNTCNDHVGGDWLEISLCIGHINNNDNTFNVLHVFINIHINLSTDTGFYGATAMPEQQYTLNQHLPMVAFNLLRNKVHRT